jgi:hypothetical protein
MPVGYFAPCDIPALRDYCDTRHEYMRVLRAMTRAKGKAKAFNAVEFRAVAKLLLAQMRALRMLPSTRLHKVTAGNLAAAPMLDRDDQRPGWRQIMDRAAAGADKTKPH